MIGSSFITQCFDRYKKRTFFKRFKCTTTTCWDNLTKPNAKKSFCFPATKPLSDTFYNIVLMRLFIHHCTTIWAYRLFHIYLITTFRTCTFSFIKIPCYRVGIFNSFMNPIPMFLDFSHCMSLLIFLYIPNLYFCIQSIFLLFSCNIQLYNRLMYI